MPSYGKRPPLILGVYQIFLAKNKSHKIHLSRSCAGPEPIEAKMELTEIIKCVKINKLCSNCGNKMYIKYKGEQ